jgi:tetratricopeptide (TPR) repeat protein
MRTLILLSFTIAIASVTYSQSVCSYSNSARATFNCIEGYSPSYPSLRMTNIINEILNTAGLSNSNFIVKSCSGVDNALAFIYNNERYILMDENFFNSFSRENLMYVIILAHEIGHHLHGHVSLYDETDEDSRNSELQADQFAGFIIGKLGFEFTDVELIAKKLLPEAQSSSHPGLNSRIDSYLKGYNAAIKQDEKTINKYYDEIKDQAIKSILNNNILKARNNYVELIDDFSRLKLDETIDSYLALKFLSNDLPWIEGELAELYAYKHDYVNANILSLNSYNKLNSLIDANSFLILAWEYSRRGGFEIDSSYTNKLNALDYTNINNPTILKYYARFLLDSNELEKALIVLDKAVDQMEGNLIYDSEILLSDILNDRAIVQLRLENYYDSEIDISRAIEIRDLTRIEGSTNNMNFLIDISNDETIRSNYLLILLRNEKFDQCLTLGKQFLENFPLSIFVENGDVDYYIGRSLFELQRYAESLEHFNRAISKTQANSFIYLYRGLVYNNIGMKMKACIDLTIACDLELLIACNRLKLLCDE